MDVAPDFVDPGSTPLAEWVILTEASLEGISRFTRGLREAAYGLWTGNLSYEAFEASMELTLQIGLTDAWYQGAQAVGITPDELTTAERSALKVAIFTEYQYLSGFAAAIMEGSRANGGAWGTFAPRLTMWQNRWNDIYHRAMVMAGADKKQEWRLGNTEKHCEDCLRLNGKVKRGSVWAAYGVSPQSHLLACFGLFCDCGLFVTDKPCTRGRLPRLVGPKVRGEMGERFNPSQPRDENGLWTSTGGTGDDDTPLYMPKITSSIGIEKDLWIKATANIAPDVLRQANIREFRIGEIPGEPGASGYENGRIVLNGSDVNTLAHEIGHAVDLSDVGDHPTLREARIALIGSNIMTGPRERVASLLQSIWTGKPSHSGNWMQENTPELYGKVKDLVAKK